MSKRTSESIGGQWISAIGQAWQLLFRRGACRRRDLDPVSLTVASTPRLSSPDFWLPAFTWANLAAPLRRPSLDLTTAFSINNNSNTL